MSDNTSIDPHKISISFSRKISDGNYGSIEATVWVSHDMPNCDDFDANRAISVAQDMFNAAKIASFEQLGIEYEYDAETSTITEKVNAVPNIDVAAAAAARVLGATEVSAQNTPNNSGTTLRVMNPADQDGPLPDWLYNATSRDGVTAVWDNRKVAAASEKNLPLFKEAVARGTQGHGKDGAPKGYWAPR